MEKESWRTFSVSVSTRWSHILKRLEDPRSTVNRQHPLVSVVGIALMAVLASAGGPTAIAGWAMMKAEFLITVLNLPNGIPRKDVFRRVLMTLKPGAFQACFANRLQSLRTKAAAATSVGATGSVGPWQDGTAEPRSRRWSGRPSLGQYLGE
jgi:DDE_Tnp_1-associated